MKRTFIVSMALAVLVALAVPAFAGKGGIPGPPEPPDEPNPTTTTTMAVPEVCDFDTTPGVLGGWDGSSHFHYRCQWIVEDRSGAQEFRIEDAGGATSIRSPYLAVTDVYPYGGDICERQHVTQADLPFDFDFQPPVILPADGNCEYSGEPKPDTDGPESFALTIGVQKVTPKDGKVQLVWVNYPGPPS
ncbi:MAG: hypothetical protein HKN80_12975 [Acidimicrobiia bacterium]|nr:hypothetical protein [Acidimicrobiia bacterium]